MKKNRILIEIKCNICGKELDLKDSTPVIFLPTKERVLICSTCNYLSGDGMYRRIKNGIEDGKI